MRRMAMAITCAAAAGIGCGEDGGGGEPKVIGEPGPASLAPVSVTPSPKAGDTDTAFLALLQGAQEEAADLTIEGFLDYYHRDDAPVPLDLSYDPKAAQWFGEIDAAYELTPAELALLDDNGFVVSPRLAFPTFVHALGDIWERDLPLLVTSDMMLEAFHRSFDALLMALEEGALVDLAAEMLAAAHTRLGEAPLSDDESLRAVQGDADVFLTVARSLLAGAPTPAVYGAAVDAAVSNVLAAVESREMLGLVIFGVPRVMDFSQFEPRGHYEDSVVLRRYFQALMWLGRVDLRFVEFDLDSGTWLFHARQLAVATLLDDVMRETEAFDLWSRIDDAIGALVGQVDYLDLRALATLRADFGLSDAASALTLDAGAVQSLADALTGGVYGVQQIASHYIRSDLSNPEPTPLPVSFALLGQRYVVDSHVFSQVVFDRVVHQGQVVPRELPNPLDVVFALGGDLVAPLLVPGMEVDPYQGNLHVVRKLVDTYDEEFWTSSVYNGWLSALRTLNAATTGTEFPEAMRTPAWRDHAAETWLGSWAQLRHDTILYAKQSYTSGFLCSYPDGFVEPRPAFYAALRDASARASNAFTTALAGADDWLLDWVEGHFDRWKDATTTLEAIAVAELAGEPLTAAQTKFLDETLLLEDGCGGPTYWGWYYQLFFESSDAETWAPTIADVHTNPPQAPPLTGPNVLHVATGDPELMVFTVETCDGPQAFVGPVFSYYEVDVPEVKRLADSDWEEILEAGEAPPRPSWTSSFRPAP